MRKNILQDVVADKRKRGYDIGRRVDAREEVERHSNNSKGGFPKVFIWIIAIASILFLVFSVSVVFSGATVKIEPRQEAISLNDIFTADKRTVDIGDRLPFDIVAVSQEASKEVPATGVQEVQRKASGTIVVYNNYSSQGQKFVKNTRFESPSGKIYRIMKSITVPGTTVSGGEIIPGSIEAEIFADETGEEYNIATADFTIPGLKDSPMYEKFYARSKTAISGGFSGEMKTVSDSDRANAQGELRTTLEVDLRKALDEQKPEGFVLYPDAVFTSFEEGQVDAPSDGSASNKATIVEKGTMQAIIFDEKVLSSYIARSAIESFDGGNVEVVSLENLAFKLLNKDTVDLGDDSKVSFRLSGDMDVVWVVDEDVLKNKFAGTRKRDFQSVMAEFLNIERAEVSIRPFWKKSFPDSIKKIKIEVLKKETSL